ncbi:MAG: LPS assembly lipoprotein LptE [Symbiopectobacterium sp.]
MRHRLFMLLLGLAMLVTTSCGFRLRGTTQFPSELKVLTLISNDPFGPLTRDIRDQLCASDIRIEEDAARQDIVSLRILSSTEARDTVSIFQDGTTAEYKLVLTVQAQVLLPGEDIYPLSVTVFRTFFDNPFAALAKDAEQDIIRKEMRRQAVEQLVRKLVTINGSDEIKTTSNVPPPLALITGIHDLYLSGTACRAAQ